MKSTSATQVSPHLFKAAVYSLAANILGKSCMKTIFSITFGFILLFGSEALLEAQSLINQPAQTTTLPPPTPYAVVAKDANSSVWQQTVYQQTDSGQVVPIIHSYTEVATGLHFWNSGQWLDSQEVINILPNGTAAATQGQHQASFPGDIYNGQIELVTPDGLQLKSQPLGLNYFDGTNSVLIAELTNSVGQVLGANQVIYTNAYTGLTADLVYTYTKAGFEQDVVLRQQPPTPESLGLNPATSRLQVLTEFFSPPQPAIQQLETPAQAGLSLMDDNLGFGLMQMIPGRAFLLGENATEVEARVSKEWVQVDGRQLLVEEVPVNAIVEGLVALPLTAMQSNSSKTPHTVSKGLVLPPQRLVKNPTKPVQMAKTSVPIKGLVLDYQTINSNQTNFTFQADTTYYISSPLTLLGTNTFEGGTVLKFATNASLSTTPTMYSSVINWQAGPYRPVVFTAKDDNTEGEIISGSTGTPTNYYANPAWSITAPSVTPTIANFRISHARQAVSLVAESPRRSNINA
jgi:hypothetical protein